MKYWLNMGALEDRLMGVMRQRELLHVRQKMANQTDKNCLPAQTKNVEPLIFKQNNQQKDQKKSKLSRSYKAQISDIAHLPEKEKEIFSLGIDPENKIFIGDIRELKEQIIQIALSAFGEKQKYRDILYRGRTVRDNLDYLLAECLEFYKEKPQYCSGKCTPEFFQKITTWFVKRWTNPEYEWWVLDGIYGGIKSAFNKPCWRRDTRNRAWMRHMLSQALYFQSVLNDSNSTISEYCSWYMEKAESNPKKYPISFRSIIGDESRELFYASMLSNLSNE